MKRINIISVFFSTQEFGVASVDVLFLSLMNSSIHSTKRLSGEPDYFSVEHSVHAAWQLLRHDVNLYRSQFVTTWFMAKNLFFFKTLVQLLQLSVAVIYKLENAP
ncbi:hypothetical protein C5167_023957 [Papaver somniferum]|uniref:Uncharacterized protein n=1 Tax=Papaver somniferum TaxID=3469 RepID=A0A4Y7JMB0_PAPSO|nr:hypothetical protein C5167_023957 [Papaver somniferum]